MSNVTLISWLSTDLLHSTLFLAALWALCHISRAIGETAREGLWRASSWSLLWSGIETYTCEEVETYTERTQKVRMRSSAPAVIGTPTCCARSSPATTTTSAHSRSHPRTRTAIRSRGASWEAGLRDSTLEIST